jgi:hypothetical protein
MARYRKKPVVVDAWQFDGTWETAKDIVSMDQRIGWSEGSDGTRIVIDTLDGQMVALPGDWVIRGVKNEFYPCKPDVFVATYDPEER